MKRLQLDYGEPAFTLTAEGRLELVHDWKIQYRGEWYMIPQGFVTDGASIPVWLQWLCGSPWKMPRFYAALVHDFLYSGGDPEATRADADDLFRDLQIALGIPRWKAYTEWAALRLFGWTHWQGTKGGKTQNAAEFSCFAADTPVTTDSVIDRKGINCHQQMKGNET